ncbi:LiaI-LiaF-like domain-containing protein [Cellulomonas sp. KRMCY2]|uniref:LiaF transmembrane domain-containing protein n=1 Tax=Cellulomonas sp. KRMCY2 TaxID=1304865 RepID=UPI00045E91FE|nr:DUF5668 domain-containing protein [Cellulomonas sp. KRMCY2]
MNRRPLQQVVLGILIVAVGVAALLGALDIVDVSLGEILGTWWPMAIIVVGFTSLLGTPRAWIGPVGVIAVGTFLMLSNLGLVEVDVWELLWPVAIILVGLSLITRFGSHGTDEQMINSAVMWWGSERRTTSQDFRGGSLSAIMGGIDVDLRQADIVEHAEVSVFVFWGGVEIKVPPTWRVQAGGLPVLGGWEDKTVVPADPNAPVLVVNITAIMGGVEVKN